LKTVEGHRSFANLAEGKVVCVMEAPNQGAVATFTAAIHDFGIEHCRGQPVCYK